MATSSVVDISVITRNVFVILEIVHDVIPFAVHLTPPYIVLNAVWILKTKRVLINICSPTVTRRLVVSAADVLLN